MNLVRPKKNLGQHFLKDREIARKVASSLGAKECDSVLEIGPGTGVLTEYLVKRNFPDFRVIEIDNESVHYLREKFPAMEYIIRGDFLRMDLEDFFSGNVCITGNFPYNISSQILFRVLEYRNKVTEVCGMFQKEVAERICSPPGSRVYGILSVLLQAYYHTEYLFTVPGEVFSPPPKVNSGVVRLVRNDVKELEVNETLFRQVVKAAFSQRRKKLRNSIRSAFALRSEDCPLFDLRPEQLSVNMFADLTKWIEENRVV
ncbi:MAG TPA: 16S rRNA (adenine(1518)-N(6)/adenine(1519)-N(6))-dimethyltransferase RsmA [Bacteroidales bacterium]|jgi:16S rRNA (adenine1518-N6/adenine1519-N6)-dimethyltransferase|nr:16S rRNA (adenine(1518)-N(6)/adenine(1519)-N(6))-dimethyltransferase RsmA [Bacteroidales bacterium]HQH24290.1 16S rRNA (adenine(1518)-N(6)/adenine(1519)-N(6))-dimethyltransferase RsmA [Bacteroidales bacterium]HQJ81526.1 16S rRNA (adenine(1518)-N(6)/adenine(1519)-N(6))-dimethyltransferase RsmA [Bacteroidales bacterium]